MTIRHFNRVEHADEWRRFRWALFGLVAVSALIFLASCGEGPEGNPVSPTTAPPTPPAPRLLLQGSYALPPPVDEGAHFFLVPVTDSASGQWEATVNWSSEANTLWMWVADGVCTVEQFEEPECPFDATCPCRFAVRSETATPKPRVLTIPAASSGTRTLIVANLGPGDETVQYRVTLTPSTAGAHVNAQSVNGTDAPGVSTAVKTGLSRK